jgi:hypothetical protein
MSWPPQDGDQNPPQYGSQQPQGQPPQYGQPYGQPQYGQPQYARPQYGQPQYAQQPGYGTPYQAAPTGTNIMAILSLVFAFVFSPAGIVLGHIAKRQLRTSGESGGGIATAGLILSYIFTALWVLGCLGVIILAASTNHTT